MWPASRCCRRRVFQVDEIDLGVTLPESEWTGRGCQRVEGHCVQRWRRSGRQRAWAGRIGQMEAGANPSKMMMVIRVVAAKARGEGGRRGSKGEYPRGACAGPGPASARSVLCLNPDRPPLSFTPDFRASPSVLQSSSFRGSAGCTFERASPPRPSRSEKQGQSLPCSAYHTSRERDVERRLHRTRWWPRIRYRRRLRTSDTLLRRQRSVPLRPRRPPPQQRWSKAMPLSGQTRGARAQQLAVMPA